MTIVPSLIGPVYPQGSVPQIVPFSIRETPSLMYLIERMREWLNDELVPFINASITTLVDGWEENKLELIEAWEQLSADLIARVDQAVVDITNEVDEAKQAAIASQASADLAEMYASQVVAFQDQAIGNIAGDTDSITRGVLDGLYAGKSAFESVSNVIATGRLSADTIDERFSAKADIDYVDDAVSDEIVQRNLAIDAVSQRIATATPSKLISALNRGTEDVTVAVLGDSTGNANNEWVYLLFSELALSYPEWTFNYNLWDDITQAYISMSPIQNGTGSRVATIYNGSHPGASHEYPTGSPTRFTKMIPVSPTTVITSFGYNWGTVGYRDAGFHLAKWILAYFPACEIVMVSQPPKATTDADNPASLSRSRDIRDVAISMGFGMIDAAQAFIDYGNYNELIESDGVHPTPTGSLLWKDVALNYFNPVKPQPVQTNPNAFSERMFVSPAMFTVTLGAPAIGIPVNNIQAWVFSANALEIITHLTDIPSKWKSANVSMLWASDAQPVGDIVLSCDFTPITPGVAEPLSGTSTPGSVPYVTSQLTKSTIAGQQMRVERMHTKIKPAGSPVAFRIRRLGNDPADTYTGTLRVYGIMIERAE